MLVGVLVPVKAFADAKQRLGEVLPAADRERLARAMAARVVASAAPLGVWVVTDDDDVAVWAVEQGATPLRQERAGLNPAVTDAVAVLASAGVDRVIVAHGDLPFATDLAALAAGEGVTVVPDRHDDGSNVLVVPTNVGFRFAYGPGSFARHLMEAERLNLPTRVVRDPGLGWDVDRPDDLVALEEPWTCPASPR
ncbi:MAG: 2-phospho-L-lactate guanylyltransferase [Acidimicrobiales bacterium]